MVTAVAEGPPLGAGSNRSSAHAVRMYTNADT